MFQLSVPSVLPSFDIARVKLPATGLAPEFAEALTALLPGIVLPPIGGSGRQALAEGGKELPEGADPGPSDGESPDPEGAIAWLPAPLAVADPVAAEASADDVGRPAEVRPGHVLPLVETGPSAPTDQRNEVSPPVADAIARPWTSPTPPEDRPAPSLAATEATTVPVVPHAPDRVTTRAVAAVPVQSPEAPAPLAATAATAAPADPSLPIVRDPVAPRGSTAVPHPGEAIGRTDVSPDRSGTVAGGVVAAPKAAPRDRPSAAPAAEATTPAVTPHNHVGAAPVPDAATPPAAPQDRADTAPVVRMSATAAAPQSAAVTVQPVEAAPPRAARQDVDSPALSVPESQGVTVVARAQSPAAVPAPATSVIPAARAAPIAIPADVVPSAPRIMEATEQPVVVPAVRADSLQPASPSPGLELVPSSGHAPWPAASPRATTSPAIILPSTMGTPASAPTAERLTTVAPAAVPMPDPVLARTDPVAEPAARAAPVVAVRREAAPEATIPAAPAIPLAEALAPLRRTAPRDSTAMVAVTQLAPEAPRLPATPQPVDATAQGEIDTRRDQWMATMVERIEALRDAAPVRETSLRLAPDALGTLDVTVTQDGDGIQVHFTAESGAARALISDAQPRLVELAEARGLRVTQTSVDAGAAGQGQGQGQRQEATSAAAPAPARTAAESESTDERIA